MDTDSCLKEMQQERPLSPHWLKKDFVSDIEMLFIYYNIDPIDIANLQGPVEWYINLFDKEHLWEVMMRSDIPFVRGRGIPLKEFIEFLKIKQFPVLIY